MMRDDVVNQKQNDFWLHELRIANYETVLEFRKKRLLFIFCVPRVFKFVRVQRRGKCLFRRRRRCPEVRFHIFANVMTVFVGKMTFLPG